MHIRKREWQSKSIIPSLLQLQLNTGHMKYRQAQYFRHIIEGMHGGLAI